MPVSETDSPYSESITRRCGIRMISITDHLGWNPRDLTNGWDTFFLGLAKYVSGRSKDPSTKVGSVIVRPDRTVAGLGYNGFPKKMPDPVSLYLNRDEKYSRIIHAEINALLHTKESVQGYTLYNYPFIPCDRCVVQMIQAGITTIVSMELAEELKERWGLSLHKTRNYCKETNVLLYEVPYSILEVQNA